MMHSIGQKMTAISVAVFLLVGASAACGLWAVKELSVGLEGSSISSEVLRNHMQADMMHDALRADVLSALFAGVEGQPSAIDVIRADTTEHIQTFRTAIAESKRLVHDEEVSGTLNELDQPLSAYIDGASGIVDLAAKDIFAAKARLPEFLVLFGSLETAMEAASEKIEAMAKAASYMAQVQAASGQNMMILAIILGAVSAVSLAVFSRISISSPVRGLAADMLRLGKGELEIELKGQQRRDEIGDISRAVRSFQAWMASQALAETQKNERQRQAERELSERQSAIDNSKAEDLKVFVHAVEDGFNGLAEGDLTVRMNQAVAPEFEPIRAKFNESIEKLEDTIGSVVNAISAIRVGLTQITVASADLSQRTEQQAASLEETVAALAEVTRGVNDTAGEAGHAQVAAVSATKNAEKGGAIVAQAVAAMSQIEESSGKVGKIIGVIDEIAFQTNLLALNAGVEAARAGEAGRGFAVVAQEVRGLAQRSAEAAKEIKDLISTSSAQVVLGVELVTNSGKSLQEIVEQVSNMSGIVSGIATSAKEQSLSLREVSMAADNMDKVTQQNAAMVEETTAAAQSLTAETEALAQMVEQFRTKTGTEPARSSSLAVKPRLATSSTLRAVTQMRTIGSGRAAVKPAPAPESWEEF
jgi:methyl-accepting chemotaxis protein